MQLCILFRYAYIYVYWYILLIMYIYVTFCILFILQKPHKHVQILLLMYDYSPASTKCTRLTRWRLNTNKPVSTTPEGCGYSLTGVCSQLGANQRVTHTDFTKSILTCESAFSRWVRAGWRAEQIASSVERLARYAN